MAYTGSTAAIPLGQLGLRTDDSMTSLPPNAAIKANNVDFFSSRLEKSKGVQQFNTSALSASVEGLFDWWANPTSQACIASTADGKIWQGDGSGTFTAIKTGLNGLTNACFFTAGGQETSNANRKLFLFSSANPTQVLSGSGSTTYNIAYPALDWINGSFPTVGVIFQNRLAAASKHTVYLSNSILQNTALAGTTPIDNIPTWYSLIDGSTSTTPVVDWYSLTYPNSGVTYHTVSLFSVASGTSVAGPVTITSTTASSGTFITPYSYAFSGLSLTNGQAYYAQIKGFNAANVQVYQQNSQNLQVNTAATGTGLQFSIYGHEDFRLSDGVNTARDAAVFPIFPGEGEEIVAMNVYKGRLFIFKRPFGAYYIDFNNSASPSAWSVQKLSDAFGVASAHAIIQPQDDLVVGNNVNSITSLQAVQAFGDIKNGDILANNQVEQYFKTIVSTSGIPFMHAIYYAEKKKAYFTCRGATSTKQDQMFIIDVARQNSRFSFDTNKQATCLSLRKGTDNIQRPFYGSDDGNIYLMEQNTYNSNGVAYIAEFQTPYTDLSYLDQSIGGKNKIFDFLEVQFIATGNWSFFVDVYCDNRFVETLNYNQAAGSALDSFVLDTDILAFEYTQETRLPMHATGRRISLRIYNNGLNQFFKVEKLVLSFRVSGEQQAGVTGIFKV